MSNRLVLVTALFTMLLSIPASAEDGDKETPVNEETTIQKDTSDQTAFHGRSSSKVHEDVRFFQFFYKDGALIQNGYADAGIAYMDYDNASAFHIGAQGGYQIMPKIQVDGEVNLINWDTEYTDGETGLSDILISARYLLFEPGVEKFSQPGTSKLQATVGGYATLPVGSEDVNQGRFNFGAFCAARYPLENGLVVAGNIGLDIIETSKVVINIGGIDGVYIEEDDDHELALSLGGGLIYPMNDRLSIVGEANLVTEGDYFMMSGGADYQLGSAGRVRAALGVGLDDGAPDFMLTGRYMLMF